MFLGVLDDRAVLGGLALDDDPEADAAEYRDLRMQWGALDDVTWNVAGRAVQLVEWQRTHGFCGRYLPDGTVARPSRARRCPACGLLAFPRLAPADDHA